MHHRGNRQSGEKRHSTSWLLTGRMAVQSENRVKIMVPAPSQWHTTLNSGLGGGKLNFCFKTSGEIRLVHVFCCQKLKRSNRHAVKLLFQSIPGDHMLMRQKGRG